MTQVARFDKISSEVLDYAFDFVPTSAWLASGETISSAFITTSPTSQLGVTSITNTGSSVLCFIGSGVVNSTYDVACSILTSAGREAVRMLELHLVDKR